MESLPRGGVSGIVRMNAFTANDRQASTNGSPATAHLQSPDPGELDRGSETLAGRVAKLISVMTRARKPA